MTFYTHFNFVPNFSAHPGSLLDEHSMHLVFCILDPFVIDLCALPSTEIQVYTINTYVHCPLSTNIGMKVQ